MRTILTQNKKKLCLKLKKLKIPQKFNILYKVEIQLKIIMEAF